MSGAVATPTKSAGAPMIRWVFLAIALILTVLYLKYDLYPSMLEKAEAEKAKALAAAQKAAVTEAKIASVPAVVYRTTPATVIANYGFNIESDGPVMIQYPDEKPFLFTPGKGCQLLPQPRSSGPKKFWDPKDVENGHVAFRLYPVPHVCAN